MWNCKHCKKEFDELSSSAKANHTRWCDKNPKREEYVRNGTGSQLNTPAAIEKRRWKIADAHANGKYKGAALKAVETKRANGNLGHTEKTIEKLRESALASDHRRLLKSTRWYTQIDGTPVLLDSSWEEALAKRLDSLGVKWIRPATPIKWKDVYDKNHNYFPDFYLPDFDIFLDPKNPYAVKVQQEKLEIIKTLIPNLRILTSLQECEEFVI